MARALRDRSHTSRALELKACIDLRLRIVQMSSGSRDIATASYALAISARPLDVVKFE